MLDYGAVTWHMKRAYTFPEYLLARMKTLKSISHKYRDEDMNMDAPTDVSIILKNTLH